MRSLFLALLLSAGWCALSGCATVGGTVTYFYEEVPPVDGTTVAVIPHEEQAKTLEWDVYKGQIEAQLERAGFTILPNSSRPTLYCTATYSIDAPGDTRTRTVTQSVNGRVVGVSNVTSQVHQRVLVLRFFRESSQIRADGRPFVEIRVVSEGGSADLATVMPALTQIALSKWPGKEGKSYFVEVPL